MATTTSKLGLMKPAYTDAADVGVLNNNCDILDREVAKRTRVVNLLDNSDFRNPVNQRKQTSYSGARIYCIDRWLIGSSINICNCTITATGIRFSGNTTDCDFEQLLENYARMAGGTYTIAYKDSTGAVYCTSFTMGSSGGSQVGACKFYSTPDRHILFRFPAGADITLVWAALYEGTYTAETLPEYQPQRYATELAECQRYCLPIRYGVISGISLGTNAQLIIPTPVTMRMEAPTFFTTDAMWVYGADGTTALFTPTSTVNTGYGVRLDGTLGANLGNKPCVVPDFGGYMLADL